MMRALISIGSYEDDQLFYWHKLAHSINNKSLFLDASEFDKSWFFEIDSKPRIVVNNGHKIQIDIDSIQYCWHLRLPEVAEIHYLEVFSMLHDFLCYFNYSNGNYLYRGNEEYFASSKLVQQANLLPCSPNSSVISRLDSKSSLECKNFITKSLSWVRSIVVDLCDDQLVKQISVMPCPVLIQEKIQGRNFKSHYYRRRNGLWDEFTVGIISDEIDYRRKYTRYYESPSRLMSFELAKIVFEKFGSRFFDIDFILEKGVPTFLEVNFSPAPVYFEQNLGNGILKFSSKILGDWLRAKNV